MIERSELAGEVEWLRVGGGGGGDQADTLRDVGERGQRRDGFQRAAGHELGAVAERERIGEKERIEQPLLGLHGQLSKVIDIGQRVP